MAPDTPEKLLTDPDCIFCKIAAGEIPCDKVYENEKTFAFLDLNPVNKGHLLVIPKEHHANLLEMPDALLGEISKTTKKVAKAMLRVTKADGFNVVQNNEPAAGQTVFHFHKHIIPRLKDDGLKPWPAKSYEEGESEKIADKIRSIL